MRNHRVFVFLFPALFIIALFRVYPILNSLRISFYNWGIAGETGFVGFRNYLLLFKDPFFWQAFINTFYYTVFTVPLSIISALFFAILMNEKIKGIGFFRTVYFLPVVTSIVAVSVVWKWLYDPTRGLINFAISIIGVSPLKWLEEPRGIFEMLFNVNLPYLLKGPSLALVSLSIMSVWKSLGYNIVILLAGLQNISNVYHDAAEIDGAGRFARLRHITLPLLSPSTFLVTIMTTIVSFQVFAPVWTMTGPPPGAPLGTTSVIIYYLYQKGFEEYNVGYGSAIAFVFFIIILIVTLLQKLYLEKRVYYEI